MESCPRDLSKGFPMGHQHGPVFHLSKGSELWASVLKAAQIGVVMG